MHKMISAPLLLHDAHCHPATGLTIPPSPAPEQKRAAIRVAGRLLCGTAERDWTDAALLAGRTPGCVPAFGVHPWEIASSGDDWANGLRRMLSEHPSAWVGETGLDKLRVDSAPPPLQEEFLVRQLRLARELNRPCALHCVRLWDRLLALLKMEKESGISFILHAFCASEREMAGFAALGGYFSIGPGVLDPRFRRMREAAAFVPRERLLIETDAFIQHPDDGADDLAKVLREAAEIRGEAAVDLAAAINDNAARLGI